MTDLINQITINGETTTFLNYVNPVEGGFLNEYSDLSPFLTAAYGASGTYWRANQGNYAIRFPVPWETITTAIGLPENSLTTGSRFTFWQGGSAYPSRKYFNSTNGNSTVSAGFSYGGAVGSSPYWYYVFAVADRYSLILVSFSTIGRTTMMDSVIAGWLKGGLYAGALYPYNFYCFRGLTPHRANLVNSTGTLALKSSQTSLVCQTATAGANSTDLLAVENRTNGPYLGRYRNMITLPSTAVVGKIYKNTGIDPDTGVIETDQKAFWMCVGSWGTDKIGIRVWTEGIV